MTLRAFARFSSFRFLYDADWPERLHAQEQCHFNPQDQNAYWHSCGAAPVVALRRAAESGLSARWTAPHRGCPWREHRIVLTAPVVAELLVALDGALEAGMPKRSVRVIGADLSRLAPSLTSPAEREHREEP